ncbi:aminotransferase class V-fold PLP-dependent enzyme [Kamptonema cortianum]|nr:aminotransferase class V-fold PLP-dependent enzyme [Geitlerinema splendidum]MDK3157675.1 aminotransferase class V-fold PLP-dependent enzyme [Kamptonema cortianum]
MTEITDADLADLRSRFSRSLAYPDIYLANHSLGRPLDEVEESMSEFLDHWYSSLELAWEAWMSKLDEYGQLISELLEIGRPDAVVLKTSAGQGLRAVLNAIYVKNGQKPVRVVATESEFDSIHFILKTYSEEGLCEVDWVSPTYAEGEIPLYETAAMLDSITSDTDLVVISQVMFTTGQVLPGMADIVYRAHEAGAYVLADYYHAFGVIPAPMGDLDFIVGGSYKYVLGGPGACWLAINPRLLDSQELQTPDTGWFAKEDTFSYRRDVGRASGGQGWWESTPPVAVVYQALPGLRFLKYVGVSTLRQFSLNQQSRMRTIFANEDVPLFEPSNPHGFGAFSLLFSQNAKRVEVQLKERGVVVDSRGNIVRFGPSLLNTDDEFRKAAQILRDIV